MSRTDLVLLHPPSVFKFRELPLFYGPVSDVVPSSSIFEIYPIGFLTISDYLSRHGLSVRIVNLALKMLRDKAFDPERFIARLTPPAAFGIDLHWLPHVDGSLSLAELVKKLHPDVPVILGGLSATYFHEELMRDYPFVDFVVCGESTEEPLHRLMEAIKTGSGYASVPNLVWRDKSGQVTVNERSFVPEDLDYVDFNYPHLLKMAVKYFDPSGYIPFKYWTSYPVTAVFSVRGCNHNCGTCGGSLSAFKRVCKRQNPCFRSPELVAEDIRRIAELTGAPVIVLGDLLQAGRKYGERFLSAMKRNCIRNEVCIEFFSPPPADFLETVADSLSTFNIEISPESHDINVRKTFGKSYDNAALEGMIETLVSVGCKRVDLFFMVGLPNQTYESVMDTVAYCGELMQRYGGSGTPGRILPLIAPLAPFIDPGSAIFEDPEKYGYRFFYRTLREHRQAMLMPSWKFALNYETKWMNRDEIVRSTYDGALKLLGLKEQYGVIGTKKAERIRDHLTRAIALSRKINDPLNVDSALREEIMNLNTLDLVCDKHELDWPIKGWKLKVPNIVRMLFKPEEQRPHHISMKDSDNKPRGKSVITTR
ncbi:MAG TPA: TIGR04190 family B12-binding domain/radical SAM domain protein [Nitrospirota bacterium]|nr:TIGR04190 family B12-binding domain/radical SAM domain protein [Nitrospirota bacterium]